MGIRPLPTGLCFLALCLSNAVLWLIRFGARPMSVNVAIVGATGAVGAEFLTVLAERKFPIRELRLLASARSAGKKIEFGGKTHVVQELTKDSFRDIQIAFFSAGGSISREFAPPAVSAGAIVIDNTSAFRMKDGIPLVVPEVNPEQIHKHNGLIANPNCSTIIMNVPVWPLHKANRIKRIVVSTYQAVSGAAHRGCTNWNSRLAPMPRGLRSKRSSFPIRSSTTSSATTRKSGRTATTKKKTRW